MGLSPFPGQQLPPHLWVPGGLSQPAPQDQCLRGYVCVSVLPSGWTPAGTTQGGGLCLGYSRTVSRLAHTAAVLSSYKNACFSARPMATLRFKFKR